MNDMETPVFLAPRSLKKVITHFCPGCQHGSVHRLVAEALDHFSVQERTIGVASVGCSVFLYEYFDIDVVESPHGRAPAVATGVKRARPDRIVFTYQGDGDLAAIGTSEIIHAANRGEDLTVVFVNNTTYGMTGGQMAPTTLAGQKTSTSPYGRDIANDGRPMRMAELLTQLDGTAFSARVAVNTPRNVLAAAKVMRKAFQTQVEGRGFAFVEILATCPTNWGLSPLQANERIAAEMIPCFPLGTFKDWAGADGAASAGAGQ
ncbi:thiamine pyrophosphate-dependent enzyme [Geoalkalibacter halelectricus]|uniref:Thiamine pyrophosphate-dependent enzyme n=1 Tax=Geoalkalibacter halelectricus TaxID=2847045 RepID=A0ABY5ZR90_9BACT|nr:thiamine pyrophosphate-dependent enzyme [Geoalkalibacter halelectricus]MDO3376694.1 thiamine pyrophosphate-dependent enzyme [Geoalkalibacter halelectricus]UWZ81354.1 thiamine pyrophosphate-dependent enzyme [Geoalkalibacter halelectricus]